MNNVMQMRSGEGGNNVPIGGMCQGVAPCRRLSFAVRFNERIKRLEAKPLPLWTSVPFLIKVVL